MKELNRLAEVCQQIIAESSPKSRNKHSLYADNITSIVDLYDSIFEQFVNKSDALKISGLLNELKASSESGGVTCQCCGIYTRDDIRQHIKKSHKMTCEEYKNRYNAPLLSDKTLKVYSDRVKGDKNPAYNHGGRLSPFSKNFKKYRDKTADYTIEDVHKKRVESTINGGGFNNTLSHYLNKGLSKNQAKEALRNRQTTFSLEKCIEKYGEMEGPKIWLKRQEKWQDKLKSKTREEIEKINAKKRTDSNGNPHIGGFYHKGFLRKHPERGECKGILYYIRFFNEDIEFWKIGITKHTVEKRFGDQKKFLQKYGLNYEVLLTYDDAMKNCFEIEQTILSRLSDVRQSVKIKGFKTSESFKEDVSETIRQYI
jgi:hypothetical protein